MMTSEPPRHQVAHDLGRADTPGWPIPPREARWLIPCHRWRRRGRISTFYAVPMSLRSGVGPGPDEQSQPTIREVDAIADRYVDECVERYPEIATYLGIPDHD